MWPSFEGIWKSSQGRKAAVAAINPLVERSRQRLLGIPEIVWLDPYMIGFMTMLITLIAKREAKLKTSQALAHTQSSAWADITGMRGDLVGEEVALLSATRDEAFEIGCYNALVFGQTLYGGTANADADLSTLWDETTRGAQLDFELPSMEAQEKADAIAGLWADCFDAHVVEITTTRPTR